MRKISKQINDGKLIVATLSNYKNLLVYGEPTDASFGAHPTTFNPIVVLDTRLDYVKAGDLVMFKGKQVTVKSVSDNGWIRLSGGDSVRGMKSLTQITLRYKEVYRLANRGELINRLLELSMVGFFEFMRNRNAIKLIIKNLNWVSLNK